MRGVALLLLLSVSMVVGVQDRAIGKMREDRLTLVTAAGEHVIDIEIAESEQEKALGLMFRTSLAPKRGMLFPYATAHEVTMWMKNTYISLDMVFIRGDGIVHRIEVGTEPFSEAVIASNGDVAAVLELKAGISQKIGLRPGDKVVHRLFPVKK